jgi:hypothetical protein
LNHSLSRCSGVCCLDWGSDAEQAAEKLFSGGVILSEAKDLLSARAESKADPSGAQNRRDVRMTLM